jgi:AcrR family transcriptional regulator
MDRSIKKAGSWNARSKPAPEKILDCATRLFARRGFSGVSLRDVTAAADVGMATVYYHFCNKNGLYTAVLRKSVVVCAQRLAAAVRKKGTAKERLRHFFETHHKMITQSDPHFRIVEQELMLQEAGRWNALAGDIYAPPHVALKIIILELGYNGMDDPTADFHARAAIGLAYGMTKLRHVQARVKGRNAPPGTAALSRALTRYVLSAINSR